MVYEEGIGKLDQVSFWWLPRENILHRGSAEEDDI
jgi:hypothetical protein